MLQHKKINRSIFLIVISLVLTLMLPLVQAEAPLTPLLFTVSDLLSDAPVPGQTYDLTDAVGNTRQLVTDSQGVLNLGVLEPGFYTLEQVRTFTREDGTVARVVETRDIIRIQADGLQAMNGNGLPVSLQHINPLDQGGSGLVFRFWDAETGAAAPYQSVTITRAGYKLSPEEIEYQAKLEAYLEEVTNFVALEEDSGEAAQDADKAALGQDIAKARAELDRLASLPSEDQVFGTYQSDARGILYLGPLSKGTYYATSPSFEPMTFYIAEGSPVAYLGQSIQLSTLPQMTSLSYRVDGPEEAWEATGTLYLNGSPYRKAQWTAQEPTVHFTDLPAYGPDRVAHSYHMVWDALDGYSQDIQGNVLTLTAKPIETEASESEKTTETFDLLSMQASSQIEMSSLSDAASKADEDSSDETSSSEETSETVTMIEITFESGGDIEVPSQTIEAGSLVEEPEMPDIEGQEFLGWYYLDEDGERHDFDFTEEVYEDLTLIADWSPGFDEEPTTPAETTPETTPEETTPEETTPETTSTETTTAEPTTMEPTTTTEPTTEATTPVPTTAPTTEPTTAEPTTEPTVTEPPQTLPSLPDFTLPTLPTITPDQPNATLPPRPGAQGGGVQRPSPVPRPGGELLGAEGGFVDPSENPATYDPGIAPLILIAGVAILGILVLEIWQRRRKD